MCIISVSKLFFSDFFSRFGLSDFSEKKYDGQYRNGHLFVDSNLASVHYIYRFILVAIFLALFFLF